MLLALAAAGYSAFLFGQARAATSGRARCCCRTSWPRPLAAGGRRALLVDAAVGAALGATLASLVRWARGCDLLLILGERYDVRTPTARRRGRRAGPLTRGRFRARFWVGVVAARLRAAGAAR